MIAKKKRKQTQKVQKNVGHYCYTTNKYKSFPFSPSLLLKAQKG